jgi:hypothetical protein
VSRGVFAGFEPRRPGSLSKSRQYFLCEIVIPSLECATSKLRKYYTYFAAVYFNKETPNLFRIHIHVTLSELKQQLDELNGLLTGHRDNRRVATVEYRRPSVISDGRVVSFTIWFFARTTMLEPCLRFSPITTQRVRLNSMQSCSDLYRRF